MSLLSNTASTSALRYLSLNGQLLNKSLERLSSGYKINHASDGAASLLISENMRSQMRGYTVAMSNSQQGLSMLQTADGGLQQINDHLQRLREIAVAASNGTTSTDQFTAYKADIDGELAAIDNIANGTKYGDQTLLDGSLSGAAFNIQIGANSGDTLDIKGAFADVTSATLGITNATFAATSDATTLLTNVDTALSTVSGKLATTGGLENSLQDQMNYLSIANENTSAAEASIRNTDVAAETANVARLQILQQAGAYALAQANSSTSSIISRLLQ